MKTVTLYHFTSAENADDILRHGFTDTDGFFAKGQNFIGVWVSDRPLNHGDGLKGQAVLSITLRVGVDDLSFYELVDPVKSYRQWCLPASLIRTHGKVSLLPADPAERFWHLTDGEYLDKLFASARATDLSVKQSIRVIQDSEALLTRVERLLERH